MGVGGRPLILRLDPDFVAQFKKMKIELSFTRGRIVSDLETSKILIPYLKRMKLSKDKEEAFHL
jgi:hypothetical protein